MCAPGGGERGGHALLKTLTWEEPLPVHQVLGRGCFLKQAQLEEVLAQNPSDDTGMEGVADERTPGVLEAAVVVLALGWVPAGARVASAQEHE